MGYRPRITMIFAVAFSLFVLGACDSQPTALAAPAVPGAARNEASNDTPHAGTSSEAGALDDPAVTDTTGRGGVFVGSGH